MGLLQESENLPATEELIPITEDCLLCGTTLVLGHM